MPHKTNPHTQLFPDDTLSYEAMRALGYAPVGGADVMEVLQALDKVDPANAIESWYAAFHELAIRVEGYGDASQAKGHGISAANAYLKASMYHRSSGFFLTIKPDDPRQMACFDASVVCFRNAIPYLSTEVKSVQIPFEGKVMHGYLARGMGKGKRPLVIMHTGFDGLAEETYFQAVGLNERGYTCLIFDGPGQGATLRKEGLPFRPDWEVPVQAVVQFARKLDGVDLSKLALIGYSFGGYLAPRAAAFVDDIKVCVADGGVYSMYQTVMDNMPPMMQEQLANDPAKFSEYWLEATKGDVSRQWSLQNGMYTFGAKSPAEWANMLKEYTLENGVAEKIKATTLVIGSDGDTMMGPVARPLYDHLTCPKTWLYYTAETGAQLHCQVGGQTYCNQTIGDWLDETIKPK